MIVRTLGFVLVLCLGVLPGCGARDEDRPAPAPAAATPPPAPAAPATAPADVAVPPAAAPPDAVPPAAAPPATRAGDAAGNRIMSSGGSYWVEYTIEPDPIPLNELFSIRVTVYHVDDPQRPFEDVSLAVDGRMPDHRHGMNRQPSVVKRSGGKFVIDNMLFHMPGFWELHFDLTRDGVTERALVDVDLE